MVKADALDYGRTDPCVDKERYRSFTLASKVAKRRRRNPAIGNVQPYWCRACQCFHNGGGNGRPARKKRTPEQAT